MATETTGKKKVSERKPAKKKVVEAPVKAERKAGKQKTVEAPVNNGRTKIGVVVSNKMDKTVVVAVENVVIHEMYQKYIKRTSKFLAHDEANQCAIGDRVTIEETRPLSKRKRWNVRDVVSRAS